MNQTNIGIDGLNLQGQFTSDNKENKQLQPDDFMYKEIDDIEKEMIDLRPKTANQDNKQSK